LGDSMNQVCLKSLGKSSKLLPSFGLSGNW
jgi:hypothetical protein